MREDGLHALKLRRARVRKECRPSARGAAETREEERRRTEPKKKNRHARYVSREARRRKMGKPRGATEALARGAPK